MRPSARFGAGWAIVAFACALAAPPAAAQEALDPAPAAAIAADAAPADNPLTPDEATALGNALLFDPATLDDAKPAKPLQLPGPSDPDRFAVNRTDKPDGSSTLAVKQPLASDWNAKVGADLNLAAPPPIGYRPGKPLSIGSAGQDTGSAWASVELSKVATVDARVDPASDQGKLATTIKKSIPVGDKFSITLQDGYSVTETFGPPSPTPSDLPLMAAPVATSAPTSEVWGSQKTLKFDILSTGTTFGAGIVTASNDPVTHRTLSADQKLYGPLHVTTAVTDVGRASSGKSITAGLKLNW